MLKRSVSVLVGVLVAAISLGVCVGSASASGGPVWRVLSVANPTNFKPGDQSGADMIVVTAVNVGGDSTDGSPVTVSDVLPPGLKAVEVFGDNAYHDPVGRPSSEPAGFPDGLSCTLSGGAPSCTTSERIDPGDTLVVTIRVHVETSVEGSGEVNGASVSGGGAVSASVSDPVTVSTAPAGYGIAKGGLLAAMSTSQAGGHPNVTAAFFLNTINPGGEAVGGTLRCCSFGLYGPGPAGCVPEGFPLRFPQGFGRYDGWGGALHDGKCRGRGELSAEHDGGRRDADCHCPWAGYSSCDHGPRVQYRTGAG